MNEEERAKGKIRLRETQDIRSYKVRERKWTWSRSGKGWGGYRIWNVCRPVSFLPRLSPMHAHTFYMCHSNFSPEQKSCPQDICLFSLAFRSLHAKVNGWLTNLFTNGIIDLGLGLLFLLSNTCPLSVFFSSPILIFSKTKIKHQWASVFQKFVNFKQYKIYG